MSGVRRVLPALLLGAAAAVLLVRAAQPLSNLDTYFHLRFGHEFLTGAWSLRHPGSVTSQGTAEWVPTQWLAQVVMAQAEEWFGLAGVAWLAGLQFLTLALVLYWSCRRYAEPLVAAVLVALALVACTPGISMRPQVISYVLVVVTSTLWLRARDNGRVPWVLVPVTYVWTMCHGMWPVGILVGVVAVAGLALDRVHPRRTLLLMAAVPVLSALAALLTPVGPRLLPAVLQVTSRSQYFYEWRAPDYHRGYALVLLLLLAAAVVPRLRRGRVPWVEIGLLGTAAACAVYSLRTVPVAAVLVAPLAALAVQPVLGARPGVRRGERLLLLGGYAAALVALAVVVPHTADRPRATAPWLDGALRELPPGTRVVDDQSFGGYLMWRFPQLDVVISGYGDLYTDDELERNADIEQVRGGWVELLEDTGAEYAVLPPGSALAYGLRVVEHWDVLEDGGDLQLLHAPAGWGS